VSSRKALGKGLGALIGDGRAALSHTGAAEGRLRELSLEEIAVNRRQPRHTFGDEDIAELAASIKVLGVVQPVVVRPLPSRPIEAAEGATGPAEAAADLPPGGPRYELIAGERRQRAARLAGLERVPALVRPADEAASLEIAVAENVAREDLNSIEEAHAYAAIVDEFGLTHERVAELVGRSRAAVSNILRLLDLPDDVQGLLESGELSEGHGRALLALADHGQRRTAARLVVAQGLSVRQTEELVRGMDGTVRAAKTQVRPGADPELGALIDELYGIFEAPVRIRSGRRGGTIQIAFKDKSEMGRLIGLLRSIRS
jgi:ParB family transcriptional regulator, chromosome partitioning protein